MLHCADDTGGTPGHTGQCGRLKIRLLLTTVIFEATLKFEIISGREDSVTGRIEQGEYHSPIAGLAMSGHSQRAFPNSVISRT
jgi:hypothetical protein